MFDLALRCGPSRSVLAAWHRIEDLNEQRQACSSAKSNSLLLLKNCVALVSIYNTTLDACFTLCPPSLKI